MYKICRKFISTKQDNSQWRIQEFVIGGPKFKISHLYRYIFQIYPAFIYTHCPPTLTSKKGGQSQFSIQSRSKMGSRARSRSHPPKSIAENKLMNHGTYIPCVLQYTQIQQNRLITNQSCLLPKDLLRI